MFCSPSPRKTGPKYEIIGPTGPALLSKELELKSHTDNICKKHGIYYLDQTSKTDANSKVLTRELFKVDTRILAGHNQHEALL
jgi:hypothetical protein